MPVLKKKPYNQKAEKRPFSPKCSTQARLPRVQILIRVWNVVMDLNSMHWGRDNRWQTNRNGGVIPSSNVISYAGEKHVKGLTD